MPRASPPRHPGEGSGRGSCGRVLRRRHAGGCGAVRRPAGVKQRSLARSTATLAHRVPKALQKLHLLRQREGRASRHVAALHGPGQRLGEVLVVREVRREHERAAVVECRADAAAGGREAHTIVRREVEQAQSARLWGPRRGYGRGEPFAIPCRGLLLLCQLERLGLLQSSRPERARPVDGGRMLMGLAWPHRRRRHAAVAAAAMLLWLL